MKNKSTMWILAALVFGILSGLLFHWLLPDATRESVVSVLDTVTHMFLNLIKMIIAPLIFATLVSGIAGAAKSAGVGKLFGRSMIWFLSASVLVGAFGFITAHVLNVGHGLNLVPGGDAGMETKPLDYAEFMTHIIPTSVFAALTANNPLQILVFGALFGIALLNLRKKGRSSIADAIDELMGVMLKVTGYVMKAAPVGVFAGIAAAFTAEGLDAFRHLRVVHRRLLRLALRALGHHDRRRRRLPRKGRLPAGPHRARTHGHRLRHLQQRGSPAQAH